MDRSALSQVSHWRARPWLQRLLVLGVLADAVAACERSSPPNPEPCGREQAAFRVHLGTEEGQGLPSDTELSVRFGGGEVQLLLAGVNDPLGPVCCQPFEATDASLPAPSCESGPWASDGGVGPVALLCELWTSGVTEVVVKADGYAELGEVLQAEADECGVVTVEQRLVLRRGDGG